MEGHYGKVQNQNKEASALLGGLIYSLHPPFVPLPGVLGAHSGNHKPSLTLLCCLGGHFSALVLQPHWTTHFFQDMIHNLPHGVLRIHHYLPSPSYSLTIQNVYPTHFSKPILQVYSSKDIPYFPSLEVFPHPLASPTSFFVPLLWHLTLSDFIPSYVCTYLLSLISLQVSLEMTL